MKKLGRVSAVVCALVFSINSPSFAGVLKPSGTLVKSGADCQTAAYEEWVFLQNALARTVSLDSMASKSTLKMNRKTAGRNVFVTIDSDMKYSGRDTEQLRYAVNLRTNQEGTITESRLFYTEGYYHMEAGGQRLKVSLDLEEAKENLNFDPNSIGAAGLESIRDLKVSYDGDGNKTYTFLCDEDGMDDYLFGVYQQLGLLSADTSIKEMRGSLTINPEGYCTAQTMEMSMDVTEYGAVDVADLKIEIVYLNPGQPVDFVLPSAEGYEKIR